MPATVTIRPASVSSCIRSVANDALSLAAIERTRPDTLYASTTGGMGPDTILELKRLMREVALHPCGRLAIATDMDPAGERYAAALRTMAAEAGLAQGRCEPDPGCKDWNEALQARAGGPAMTDAAAFLPTGGSFAMQMLPAAGPTSATFPALTAAQRAAATADGPVLILAGAGTAKTKSLTAAVADRIQRRGIAPSRILAVTFTNKAAAEMTARIRLALGDKPAPHWVGTFHGLAARQLRAEPEIGGLRTGFKILDADDARRLVKRTMKAMNLAAGGDEDAVTAGRDPVKAMSNRLSKFKDHLVLPNEIHDHVAALIAEAERTGAPVDAPGLRVAARVYVEYQKRLREANAAHFGDLLLWPARTMQENDDYRRRWAGRWDAVLADEYQDVNHAQYMWLRLLSAAHQEILVVGDDDQAVYSFHGSDVSFIRRFTTDFRRARAFRLEENFRSTGHILAAANAVIALDAQRLGKTLFSRKDPGDPVEIVGFQDADDEADGLVGEMKRRHQADGLAWEDMAVLYRSNFLSRSIEEALLRARVPYTIVGDVGFYRRVEIKDALALLRLATYPDDPQSGESLRRIINTAPRGFGPKALSALEEEAAWRHVPLMTAIETCQLPPRARAAALGLADVIRRVGRDPEATLATRSRCCSTGAATEGCCAKARRRRRKGASRTSRN